MKIKDTSKIKEIAKPREADVKLRNPKPMKIASKSTDSFDIKNIAK